MISENKFNQYGFPREATDILGITIHEIDTDMTAQQIHDWLDTECKTTTDGCHYICDDTQVVQVIPDDWAVYHTDKAKDFGNRYTIAIKICSSLSDDKFNAAEDKAVELIRNLQKKYDIKGDMIFFHQDFNERAYCPKTIINKYGTAKTFVYQRLEEI